MGLSTDAIIFFGVHFPEDYSENEKLKELSEVVWNKRKYPVVVDTHCSSEYPLYFVSVSESYKRAYRGDPVRFDPRELLTDEWQELIENFLKEHNLTGYSEVGWYLVSDMG